jgi:hypothetical protein
MDRVEVDGLLLLWDAGAHEASLEIRDSADSRALTSRCTKFRFMKAGPRLCVGLAMPPTPRIIDVSPHPAVFDQVLRGQTGASRPGSCGSAVTQWVATLAEGTGIWRPAHPEEVGVVAMAGGSAFPLLGAAYDRGAAPLGSIPRWAGPVLAEATPRDAARAAFGHKATRTVVGALTSSLVHGPRAADTDPVVPHEHPAVLPAIGLLPLALALMGSPVLEPDRLARVLGQTELCHGPEAWPTGEQIAACRQIVARLGPLRTERILCDAAARVDGPGILADTVGLFTRVEHPLTGRTAGRLEDLRNQCRDLLPVDPNPQRGLRRSGEGTSTEPRRRQTPGAPPRTRSRRAPAVPDRAPVAPRDPAPRDPARRDAAQRGQALRPPAVYVDIPRATEVLPVPQLLEDLNGTVVCGRLRLVLPYTVAQLVVWGNRLGNCLGSFAPAVAAGTSWLLGVELEDRLAYCMELTPNGSIRQFLGARNQRVPIENAAAVCAHLVSAGVVDPHNRANQVWLGSGSTQ